MSTPIDTKEVFDALERWINQRPGLDPRDYGSDGWKAYRAELRSIGKDKKRAMKALDEARSLTPPEPEILADSFRAFSGRLEWLPFRGRMEWRAPEYHPQFNPENPESQDEPIVAEAGGLHYTTGQYWPTEYRKAAAAVLETYISGWRQAYAKAHPPTFTYKTMEDVIAANKSIGHHFFDASSMRFFKCKIESGLVAGKRFITSERGPVFGNQRRYTVREANPDGTIDTIGGFQAYESREAARAAILEDGERI